MIAGQMPDFADFPISARQVKVSRRAQSAFISWVSLASWGGKCTTFLASAEIGTAGRDSYLVISTDNQASPRP